MVEVLILGTATFIAGIAISLACKNSKEPTINNHYGYQFQRSSRQRDSSIWRQ
jgi:demethoxyubiquinone hydroxylase (CLK1/Coq7/Cat5 family)